MLNCAPVAQWIRASDYGSEGRGFESSQALLESCTPLTNTVSNTIHDAQLLDNDVFWMEEALELARQAADKGEVPVGAILVKDNNRIAAAHNRREHSGNPTAHAEMLVIQEAAQKFGNWRLTDTVLYVTLEPCPMCAGAIVLARIPKVVYAANDPKAGATGTLYNIVQDKRLNHQVELIGGICAEQSSTLLKTFFKNRR